MPNIAEVLRAVLSSAGQGVLHQRRQATRGGDYLERQEAADRAERSNAFARAKMSREFGAQDAQTGALAELAARSGIELTGDPEKDAALFQAIQEAEKSGLARRFTESQIKANESLVQQRENMPDQREADRELRRELAAGNADLRQILAKMAGNRPQLTVITSPDGSQRVIDKRAHVNETVGGRPMAAGEREDEAGAMQMLDDVKAVRALLGEKDVQDAMGPLAGIGTSVRRATTGVPENVNEVANRLDNVTDLLGRQRSGAVINAQEIATFRRLAASIRSNPQTAAQNLKLFEERLTNILNRRFGGRGGAFDSEGGAPTSPGQPTGGGRDKLDDALDRIFGGGR